MSHSVVLDMNSPSISHLCRGDKRLAKVIRLVGAINYKTHDDEPYDFLVHEIIEQMLSVTAGQRIYDRIASLCPQGITPQSISRLSVDEIRQCGTSRAKAEYIHILTDAVINGSINLDQLKDLDDCDVIKTLTSLRGIGTWSAKMFLIFVLDRQNVLPYEDGAFKQSYKWLYKTSDASKQAIIKTCKKWEPYSSIGARYMYRALDLGLTKKEFHLFKEG